MKIINPATEKVIQELPIDTKESVKEKYSIARKAFSSFSKTSYAERSQIIKNFQKLLMQNIDRLSKILTSEMGKPLSQAKNEMKSLNQRIEFFIEYTEDQLKDKVVYESENLREVVSFEPLGVIANISAWNYPYFVGTNVFIPAILCGNTVLYKPSEHTSLTGLEIEKLFIEANLPEGVFQCLLGKGEIGEALLEQNIDAIFFTGSYATGKKIASQVATKMIPLQLELGGKDAVYVHEDVDMASAVPSIADGSFFNNGQSCCAVERIYVHEKIYDEFLLEYKKVVQGFKIGNPLEEDTYLGPLARKELICFLEEQVEDALHLGAKLELEISELPKLGYYFSPRIFTNVHSSMRLMKEETFGPMIGIQKVKDEKEGLSFMLDTKYGLTASVYSRNEKVAKEILDKNDTGSVYWNCCDRVSPYLPWSGRKYSGIGCTLAVEGIRSFLKPKSWHYKVS